MYHLLKEGRLEEKQEFSFITGQEIKSFILDTITLRHPLGISEKM